MSQNKPPLFITQLSLQYCVFGNRAAQLLCTIASCYRWSPRFTDFKVTQVLNPKSMLIVLKRKQTAPKPKVTGCLRDCSRTKRSSRFPKSCLPPDPVGFDFFSGPGRCREQRLLRLEVWSFPGWTLLSHSPGVCQHFFLPSSHSPGSAL